MWRLNLLKCFGKGDFANVFTEFGSWIIMFVMSSFFEILFLMVFVSGLCFDECYGSFC